MEPQTDNLAQALVTGLLFAGILGIFFFLRRINLRSKRVSQQRVAALLDHFDEAHRRISRIEDEQWHERLSSGLRIWRYDPAISADRQVRLAAIDRFQEQRTTR